MDLEQIVAEYAAAYPAVVSYAQAAAIADRKVATIYDWAHRGLLDGIKIGSGRGCKFHRDGFVRFLITPKK